MNTQLIDACIAVGAAFNHSERLSALKADPKQIAEAQTALLHTQIAFLQLELQSANETNNQTKAYQVTHQIRQAESELNYLKGH